jgi:hypothetical protein
MPSKQKQAYIAPESIGTRLLLKKMVLFVYANPTLAFVM